MNTNHNFAVHRIKNKFHQQKEGVVTNKYILLYQAIKQCIVTVELPNDWVLPPTRILADELGLSRTTVIKTYELLQLEKLIKAKMGSGNTVNYAKSTPKAIKNISEQLRDKHLYPKISQKGNSYLQNINLINRLPNNNLAFRPGLPPIDVFPVNQWKKLLNTYWRHIKSSGLNYSQSTGIRELKNSISNYLNISRNIKCQPDRIVIVSGSLQSLYLIANTLIDQDDAVVVENPLFPNVHSVFKSSQANLIPIDLDAEGIDINQLRAIENEQPKIVHVTPSNQYPMGTRMSLKRRQELLQWASNNKSLIIENDYEHEIANTTESIPTLYSLDNEDRTIYMGTFNRLLHPSIRLGYMLVPEYLIEAVEALQEHSHRFVSPSIQVVMNQFIEKNYLYQHLKNCIEVANERHDIFVSEFEKVSRNMYLQEKPFSSFHLIAHFKSSVSIDHEKEVIKQLNENEITTFSLSKCYVGEAKQQGLILGFSSVRPSILKRKVAKMGTII